MRHHPEEKLGLDSPSPTSSSKPHFAAAPRVRLSGWVFMQHAGGPGHHPLHGEQGRVKLLTDSPANVPSHMRARDRKDPTSVDFLPLHTVLGLSWRWGDRDLSAHGHGRNE